MCFAGSSLTAVLSVSCVEAVFFCVCAGGCALACVASHSARSCASVASPVSRLRAGAALLGAYVGVEVGQIHVAPAVNPVFLHAVSPFLSFVPFFRFFRYSSKRESRSCPDISRCCICPVRSYCVSLSFVIVVFRVCTLSICPRRPESRESIRRRCAAPLHRNRTSPPSLWPGRELQKYHCPQHLSSPPPGAARLLSCKLYRSPVWDRGALTKAAQGFSP